MTYVSAWNDVMFVYKTLEEPVVKSYQFNYGKWSANRIRHNAIWGYITKHEKIGKAKANRECWLT